MSNTLQGIAAALALAVLTGCTTLHESAAESEVEVYVRKMFPSATLIGKSCVGGDSDGDGYVSCSANIRNQDGSEQQLSLECAKWMTPFLSGCKDKTGVIKQK